MRHSDSSDARTARDDPQLAIAEVADNDARHDRITTTKATYKRVRKA